MSLRKKRLTSYEYEYDRELLLTFEEESTVRLLITSLDELIISSHTCCCTSRLVLGSSGHRLEPVLDVSLIHAASWIQTIIIVVLHCASHHPPPRLIMTLYRTGLETRLFITMCIRSSYSLHPRLPRSQTQRAS